MIDRQLLLLLQLIGLTTCCALIYGPTALDTFMPRSPVWGAWRNICVIARYRQDGICSIQEPQYEAGMIVGFRSIGTVHCWEIKARQSKPC